MSIRDSLNTRDTLFERKGAEKIFHANNNKKSWSVCTNIRQNRLEDEHWFDRQNYIRGLIHQEDTHMNMTMDSKIYEAKTVQTEGRNCHVWNYSQIFLSTTPVSIMNKLDKD